MPVPLTFDGCLQPRITCVTSFQLHCTLFSYPVVDCGDPGTPTNGQRSLSSTTYNSVVTYTCDVGYTLQGSNNRACQSSGQWSGNVPQCNRESYCFVTLLYTLWLCTACVFYCAAICASPCQNGGTCTAPDTCTCDVGWTGMQCETGEPCTVVLTSEPAEQYVQYSPQKVAT